MVITKEAVIAVGGVEQLGFNIFNRPSGPIRKCKLIYAVFGSSELILNNQAIVCIFERDIEVVLTIYTV